MDVHNAFLDGDLHDDVYMLRPPVFIDKDKPNHVYKLQKALYGLKQSPREWFLKLSTCLLNWGFKASRFDSSLFFYNKDSIFVVVLVYVDDIIVTGSSTSFIQKFICSLNDLFAFKDLGDLSYFLGIEVQRGSGSLFLCQQKYFNDLLKRADMFSCKFMATPMAAGSSFSTRWQCFTRFQAI